MGDLTVRQNGTGDYTTLNAALADPGFASGDTITVAGTWTIADTTRCTIPSTGGIVTITADTDAANDGFVELQGGTGGSPTAAGHYRLECSGGHVITASGQAIIEGIVIRQTGTGTSDEGVRCSASVTINRCIVYTGNTTDDQDGVYLSTSVTVTLNNTIVYGWSRAGAHLQNASGSITATLNIDSCFFWSNGASGNPTSGRAVGGIGCFSNQSSALAVNVTNSIAIGNDANASGADFSEVMDGTTSTWTVNTCIDGDNSIASVLDSGSGNLASRTLVETGSGANQVVVQDITSSPYDLRLVDDATNNDAQNAGATTLTVDIAGTSRPQGSQDDIGPFEIVVGGAAATPHGVFGLVLHGPFGGPFG